MESSKDVVAKIEFDLTTPEGKKEFKRYSYIDEMTDALFHIQFNFFRKFHHRELGPEAEELLSEIEDDLLEMISEIPTEDFT